MAKTKSAGMVYLVGAGPGDPRLITVGGVDALRRADVVVYDRLVHPSLLRHAPAAAERVYVGKQADRHSMQQDDINALLADRASEGKVVVRLKGGDPFVFGRGGEEADFVRKRGIPFVIVPGVTSAIAGPAYAGIPVTHRDAASSFAVITGHERDDNAPPLPAAGQGGLRESATRPAGAAEQRRRWDRIAHAADTLIFLMGVENLDEIVSQLLIHGRSPQTPISLTRWATWAGRQETLTGTLGDIVERVKAAGFKAPAVTVVGDVVLLRDELRWFDIGPLAGKRIVVTRAREQASELVDLLRDSGAEPIEFPLIKTMPPADGYAELDAAVQEIAKFDWVLFASQTAVSTFFNRLAEANTDARALAGVKIGAVGPATVSALAAHGIRADFTPDDGTGKALGEQLPGDGMNSIGIDFVAMELEDIDGLGSMTIGDLSAARILIPRAAAGEDALPAALTKRGAEVVLATAYETVIDGEGADMIRERIAEGSIDMITFTSSSTVRNFHEALNQLSPASITLACIGPSTAKTVREVLSREPEIVAETHTITGLVEAVEKWYAAG